MLGILFSTKKDNRVKKCFENFSFIWSLFHRRKMTKYLVWNGCQRHKTSLCIFKPSTAYKIPPHGDKANNIHLLEYPIPLSSVRHVFSRAMDLGNRESYHRSAGVKTTKKILKQIQKKINKIQKKSNKS